MILLLAVGSWLRLGNFSTDWEVLGGKPLVMGKQESKLHSTPREEARGLQPPKTIIPRTFTQVLNTDATANSAPTLSVMTWNVMAEVWSPPYRYNYLPADAVAWAYRGALVLLEIETLQPDVVALQEVGANAFTNHLLPGMEALNYQGFHVRNPSSEGVALFWKKDRFKQIAQTELHMNQKAKTLVQQATEAGVSTEISQTVLRSMGSHSHHNVAGLVLLQDLQTKALIAVASTHLYWGSRLDGQNYQFQCFQAEMLLQELEALLNANPVPKSPSPATVFVCGDFNSMPTNGLYGFLHSGSLAKDDPELTRGGEEPDASTRDLRHNFNLQSTYRQHPSGKEPEYTFHHDKVACLDYIYAGTLQTNSSTSATASPYKLVELMDMLPFESFAQAARLPTMEYPSDHISLMARFRFAPSNDDL